MCTDYEFQGGMFRSKSKVCCVTGWQDGVCDLKIVTSDRETLTYIWNMRVWRWNGQQDVLTEFCDGT